MGKPIFFPTETEFRRWLEANHATAPELLVKEGSGKASIDWPQARAMHGSPAKAGAQSREAR